MELMAQTAAAPSTDPCNPQLVFQELRLAAKRFFVVRDDLLPAGTKGRAMVDYMRQHPATDFVYAGPSTGYAQIVLAYAASLCRKRAHVFVEKNEPRNSLTATAMYVILILLRPSLCSAQHSLSLSLGAFA